MIDDFATPAGAECHEKFASDVVAGFARLARWLRRCAGAKDDGDADAASAKRQSMSEAVTIAPEAAVGADAEYCLGRYYQELQERFEGGFDPELSLVPSLDEFAPPRGTFLLVRLNGEPVGCGGLKPMSREAAYLKRMWIAPGARGTDLPLPSHRPGGIRKDDLGGSEMRDCRGEDDGAHLHRRHRATWPPERQRRPQLHRT